MPGVGWHGSCVSEHAPEMAGVRGAGRIGTGLTKRMSGEPGAECRGPFGPIFLPVARTAAVALLEMAPTPRRGERNRGDPGFPAGASTWSESRNTSQCDASGQLVASLRLPARQRKRHYGSFLRCRSRSGSRRPGPRSDSRRFWARSGSRRTSRVTVGRSFRGVGGRSTGIA
jgi:hypothetical protein